MWAMTSENWSAVGSWATVAVAIVAAIVALRQVREARIARDEQAQPNVVMYTEPMEGDWQFLELVIKNFGQTPAFDIEVSLDRPLQVSPDHSAASIGNVALPSRIPILAPQQEWRALWDHAPSRSKVEGIESVHKGELTYRGERKKRQHWYAPWQTDFDVYRSPVELDFNLLKNTRRVDRKTVHDLAKTLDAHLASAGAALAEIGATLESYSVDEHKGIWVYPASPEDERASREEQARLRAEDLRRTREVADAIRRQLIPRESASPDVQDVPQHASPQVSEPDSEESGSGEVSDDVEPHDQPNS